MPIFIDENGKLKKLKAKIISIEKDLQKVIEENINVALDMYLLESEYTTTFGGRIDTLAVDQNGCPVIIEYKRNKNDNVINQALSYLKWLQQQKVEFFEMLIFKKYGEQFKNKLKIDWKNPRVICIAESYSKFDIDTVEVIPIRIELFKYRFYEEGIFSLEPLDISEQKSKGSPRISIEKPTIDMTIDDLLGKTSGEIKNLFKELRTRIFELDENIVEKVTTLYVAYRITRNFTEITIGKNQLRLMLRPREYNDPKAMVEKIPEGYQWTLNKRVYLKKAEDLDYVFGLIEQSYKDVL